MDQGMMNALMNEKKLHQKITLMQEKKEMRGGRGRVCVGVFLYLF